MTKKEIQHIFDKNREQYGGFTRKQEKFIKTILDPIGELFTGLYSYIASGGDFRHMAFQTLDARWLTFHNVSGDVTLTKWGYKDADEFSESEEVNGEGGWGEVLFEGGDEDWDYFEERLVALIKK